jgi:hypothetical protein
MVGHVLEEDHWHIASGSLEKGEGKMKTGGGLTWLEKIMRDCNPGVLHPKASRG